MTTDDATETGRRARKASATRERIAAAALRLFLARGFDATTLDAIAEAADISRRTFFHYYPSKEAVLDALDEGIHDRLRAALKLAARTSPPVEAVRVALRKIIQDYSSDEALAIDRLMHSTEALRARKQANHARQEQVLFTALCEIWPKPARRRSLEMVAMLGIGAMRIAADRWRAAPRDRSLAAELDRAFRELADEVCAEQT